MTACCACGSGLSIIDFRFAFLNCKVAEIIYRSNRYSSKYFFKLLSRQSFFQIIKRLLLHSPLSKLHLYSQLPLEAAAGGVLKKAVLKNFEKFTGKHLCQSLFLIKLQAFVKFLGMHFLQNSSERLLLCFIHLTNFRLAKSTPLKHEKDLKI